jgi:RimJ/RimL family protein N-acetyltransferase
VFGTNCLNINKFVSEEQQHLKHIISVISNNTVENVAFAHFYHTSILNQYDFVGGIAPKYFNSGIGVYACVTALFYFFDAFPFVVIKTDVYKYNLRSHKMLAAVGFIYEKETKEKIMLQLNLSLFKNNFVERILMRIKINS